MGKKREGKVARVAMEEKIEELRRVLHDLPAESFDTEELLELSRRLDEYIVYYQRTFTGSGIVF